MKVFDFFTKGAGFDWFIVPLSFVLVVHLFIWAVVAFLAWDWAIISLFGHRVIFVGTAVVVWGALAQVEAEQRKKKKK